MRKVLVPGTFDPITNGHLEVVERASRLFDQVVVAVALSQKKNGRGTLFSLDERVELARLVTAQLGNVEVMPFEGLLVDFAERQGACAFVKGLRATTDFEYEFQMTAINYQLDRNLETLFIMSTPQHMYLSSSVVREIASMGGDIKEFVPPCVERALREKFGN